MSFYPGVFANATCFWESIKILVSGSTHCQRSVRRAKSYVQLFSWWPSMQRYNHSIPLTSATKYIKKLLTVAHRDRTWYSQDFLSITTITIPINGELLLIRKPINAAHAAVSYRTMSFCEFTYSYISHISIQGLLSYEDPLTT